MPSNFYYDSGVGIPNAPTWTEEPQILKIRVVDTIGYPRFLEVWVADPDNSKQNAGTFSAYQRVKIDYTKEGSTGTIFYGRIEYLEPRYDSGYGQIIAIQAKDGLQEIANRTLNVDFTNAIYGGAANNAILVDKIIQYCIYTEIIYTNLAGGNFTVATDANAGYYIRITCGGGDFAYASIVYVDGANTKIAVDRLIHTNLTNQIANLDVITEYNGSGVATGVTAQVSGSVYRNIDTFLIDAIVAAGGTSPLNELGYYPTNSKYGLDALAEVALQDNSGGIYIYDFFTDNQNVPRFNYFRRASLNSGISISLGASETAVIKPMVEDYSFPQPIKEGATHIIAGGIDAGGILREYYRLAGAGAGVPGQTAYNLKTFKDLVVIQKAQANTGDIAILASAEEDKMGGANFQRGEVRIIGFPYRWDTGFALRAGYLVRMVNPKIAAIHNTDMLTVEIDYEEPPGIATIELVSQTKGKTKSLWGFGENLVSTQRKGEEQNAQNVSFYQLPGDYSYSDRKGNLYVVGGIGGLAGGGGLRIVDSTGNIYAWLSYQPSAGVRPNRIELFCFAPLGITLPLFIDADRVMFTANTPIGPFEDAVRRLFFQTRQTDNITIQDHVFAPRDDQHGRLGDATYRWLSAHINSITTDSILGTAFKYGTAVTDVTGTATIAHGLGAVPTAVLAVAETNTGRDVCNVYSIGAANFSVRVQVITSITADGQHTHGVASITVGSENVHTHLVSGSTSSNPPADPHFHTVSITSGAGAIHTHALGGTTNLDAPHTHTIASNPGVGITVHWLALK